MPRIHGENILIANVGTSIHTRHSLWWWHFSYALVVLFTRTRQNSYYGGAENDILLMFWNLKNGLFLEDCCLFVIADDMTRWYKTLNAIFSHIHKCAHLIGADSICKNTFAAKRKSREDAYTQWQHFIKLTSFLIHNYY